MVQLIRGVKVTAKAYALRNYRKRSVKQKYNSGENTIAPPGGLGVTSNGSNDDDDAERTEETIRRER